MAEIKIKIEMDSYRLDEKLKKIMADLKEFQQEHTLEVTLVEVLVKETRKEVTDLNINECKKTINCDIDGLREMIMRLAEKIDVHLEEKIAPVKIPFETDDVMRLYGDLIFGNFDNMITSEKFINIALKFAQENQLTFNDLKLSLKLIEQVAERSNFKADSISLIFSKNNGLGFYFNKL